MNTVSASAPHRRFPLIPIVSVTILVIAVVAAVFGPWIAPHDPAAFITETPFAPPSPLMWLGTDYLGRDMLSRLIDSTRLTLGMALAATALAHLAGDSLGLYAALKGGWVDALLSRIVDLILSLPKIIVGLVVLAALGPSKGVIVGVSALVYAAGVYRVARALGSDLVRLDFVVVAQARGENTRWILFHEILPHVVRPLAADFAIRMGFAILFMSSLSFLGLGVQPPESDWGGLVRENLDGLAEGVLAPIYPALAIAAVSIALNLLVDMVSERGEGERA